MPLIIFDIETTGFSHHTDDIIQIAALRVKAETWQVEETFSTFVRPLCPVPWHITKLTGIGQQHVRNAPNATEALQSFSRFAGEGTTLVAHNGGRFDLPFLRQAALRHGLPMRQVSAIDSIAFSRKLWGGRGGHGLDAVLQRLELSSAGQQRHDARVDVDLLHQAVQLMWQRLSPDRRTCPVASGLGMIPVMS